MNYEKIYDQLIYRAQVRELFNLNDDNDYLEKHHVLPKCLYPEYKNLNLYPLNKALLTPEEHYLAHQLLVKMNRFKNHTYYYKLVAAAILMTTDRDGNRVNNKLHGWIKRKHSIEFSKNNPGKNQTDEHKKLALENRLKTIRAPEYIDPKKGRKRSVETIAKNMEAILKTIHAPGYISPHKGRPSSRKGAKLTDDTKKKISDANTGKEQSKITIAKRLASVAKTLSGPNYVHPNKGKPSPKKGKKYSEEEKTRTKHDKQFSKGMTPWNKGLSVGSAPMKKSWAKRRLKTSFRSAALDLLTKVKNV